MNRLANIVKLLAQATAAGFSLFGAYGLFAGLWSRNTGMILVFVPIGAYFVAIGYLMVFRYSLSSVRRFSFLLAFVFSGLLRRKFEGLLESRPLWELPLNILAIVLIYQVSKRTLIKVTKPPDTTQPSPTPGPGLFCPQCGAEYPDGFTLCPDCRVELLDRVLE